MFLDESMSSLFKSITMKSCLPFSKTGRALVASALVFSTAALANADPSWWAAAQIGSSSDDKEAATIGQLKHIAAKAWEHLDESLRAASHSEGPDFTLDYTSSPDDNNAVVLGQVKAVAKPFYDALNEVGYSGVPSSIHRHYPWASDFNDANHIATIGQLKHVFSFDVSLSNISPGPGFGLPLPDPDPVVINNGNNGPDTTDLVQLITIEYETEHPCKLILNTHDPDTDTVSSEDLIELEAGDEGELDAELPVAKYSYLTVADGTEDPDNPPQGDNLDLSINYHSPDPDVDVDANFRFLAYVDHFLIDAGEKSVGNRDFIIDVNQSSTPHATIHFLSVDMVRVNEDGTPAELPELLEPSYPSPVIAINIPPENDEFLYDFGIEVNAIAYRGTNEQLRGLFYLSGTITSNVCDTLPGEDGEIDVITPYINGEPIFSNQGVLVEIDVSTQSKPALENPSSEQFGKPYPYVGEFDDVELIMPLIEGLNMLKLTASDKVFGLDGYLTLAVEVSVDDIDPSEVEIEDIKVIASSGGGEFYPFVARVRGPVGLPGVFQAELSGEGDETLRSSLMVYTPGETATTGGATYFIKHQAAGAAEQADPDLDIAAPAIALARQPTGDDPDSFTDEQVRESLARSVFGNVSDALKYEAGLIKGIGKGGVDTVVGTTKTIGSLVEIGGNYVAQVFLSFKLLFWDGEGSDEAEITSYALISLGEETERVENAVGAIGEAIKDFADNPNDVATLTLACLTNDRDVLEANVYGLSEFHQQLFIDGAEVLAKGFAMLNDPDPFKRGVAHGQLLFEVAVTFIPISKLTKSEKLLALMSRNKFKVGGKFHHLTTAVVSTQRIKLLSSKMCFVAGTLILARIDGVPTQIPIELLQPISHSQAELAVWARHEHTGEEGWKRPVAWFTTSPTELHHLSFDIDGDGQPDETLSGTAPHPFWVVEESAFLPMSDLEPGHSLYLYDAEPATATVLTNTRERASPGQTFTTYNLEVEDFHTYFVGESGVWVHNAGRNPCERIFSTFVAMGRKLGFTGNALKRKRFDILVETRVALGRGAIPSRDWGRSAATVGQKMLDDYAAGGVFSHIDEFPTFNKWGRQFFAKVTGTEVQVHHAVEKYVQKLIGVNTELRVANGAKLKNTCPGVPLPRNKKILDDINAGQLPQHQLKAVHRGRADGGIAELIRAKIPPNSPKAPQDIITDLRKIYDDYPDLANQWPVARDWLKKIQTQGHLDANLNIPD